jgi:hypothetical protein
VGFVVDKVALGQGFPRVLQFSPVNFIPPVLHYKEKGKIKLIIFIAGLHNKPQGCGAFVESAAGPFTTKQNTKLIQNSLQAAVDYWFISAQPPQILNVQRCIAPCTDTDLIYVSVHNTATNYNSVCTELNPAYLTAELIVLH